MEHLWIGYLGHFLVALFFISSLSGSIFYFQHYKNSSKEIEKKIGRYSVFFQLLSVIGIFLLLIIILTNHFYEYYYAYQHSSNLLIFKYLFSSIWEGQEGSFLLWMFWNSMISLAIILFFKKSESSVLWVMSVIQVWLGSMILGVYIGDFKLGSDPFVLLKDVFQDAPIFQQPNYLEFIKDGTGLNVLLQNYWMVIHPPVLFLGFALTAVPFCYVVANKLHSKFDVQIWKQEIVFWALAASVFLGVGIMMGAAWAYESLTFGGYWAWDPVENASLVPWLMLIAGFHANAIYNHTNKNQRYFFVFYLLAFLFVLYSTFLTRSGVLGNSSVHAFTDLGMNTQLLCFFLFFISLAFIPFIKKSQKEKQIESQKEDNTMTREFFLLIGSLILGIMALIIIAKTSLPIVNLLFGTSYAQPEDAVHSYNQSVITLTIFALFLSSFSLFLAYKKTQTKQWLKQFIITGIVGSIFFLLMSIFEPFYYSKYGVVFAILVFLLLLASCYSLFASLWVVYYKKIKSLIKMATPISHFGFALLILGILFSSAKKEVLSKNLDGFSPLKIGDEESPKENITLVKNTPYDIQSHWVTYRRQYFDTVEGKTFFDIHFQDKNSLEEFILHPDLIENNKGQEGLTPNPSVKHYWTKDIFVYITYLQKIKNGKEEEDYNSATMQIGDTVFFSKGFFVLNDVKVLSKSKRYENFLTDTAICAVIKIQTLDSLTYISEPLLYVRDGILNKLPDTVISSDVVFRLDKIIDNHSFQISYVENTAPLDFITLKIYSFPYINLVWVGTIMMFLGMVLSAIKKRLR